MPQPALVSTISTILRGEDPARRRRELTALRDQAPLETLDAMISLLGSPEKEVRRQAAKSLSVFAEHLESAGQALETMAREPEAHVYDTECGEFEAIEREIQQETGEALPWRRSWGKLETILNQARSVAKAGPGAKPGASPNGGLAKRFGNSGVGEWPPSVG